MGSFEKLGYSRLLILMIFIFHTIFEGYYLCLIIGLSQVVANLSAFDVESDSQDLKMIFVQRPTKNSFNPLNENL